MLFGLEMVVSCNVDIVLVRIIVIMLMVVVFWVVKRVLLEIYVLIVSVVFM